MSEDAAQIAVDANKGHGELKVLLRKHDPWDRDVNFQRKNLRRLYLRLLFIHPFASESKDAENHLWMQTSYALITIYKRRITELDNAINGPRTQNQAQRPIVEHRKLVQRFRQFLTEEEKFWVELVVRLRRVFKLEKAQQALVALTLLPKDSDPVPAEENPAERGGFPPEAYSAFPTLESATPEELESRVAILSKALVCLGDLARYKEQYNESGGRPRAGHEHGPPAAAPPGRNGRGRRGGAPPAPAQPMSRLRDYRRAHEFYDQARLLLPSDGNPSHQLAILATYQADVFTSVIHYYRSLCVRKPYETGSENMQRALAKAFDEWRSKEGQRQTRLEGRDKATARERVKSFKEKTIALHAVWRLAPDDAELLSARLNTMAVHEFKSLVAERLLPDDHISKSLIIAQAALWRHRSARNESRTRGQAMSDNFVAMESRILVHLLNLHRALMELGLDQLKDSPQEVPGENGLAQLITAPFRRTLPALRMGGKWTRANDEYLLRMQLRAEAERAGSARPLKEAGASALVQNVEAFWRTYAQFASALLSVFPRESLPELKGPLDEDREMSGFLPLRNFLLEEARLPLTPGDGVQNGVGGASEEGHPNVEQLKRIWDILSDAIALAEDEHVPVSFVQRRFVYGKTSSPSIVDDIDGGAHVPEQARLTQESLMRALGRPTYETRREDEDNVTIASLTTDDPVRDAIDVGTRQQDADDVSDDGDDVVLYRRELYRTPPRDVPPEAVTVTPQRSKPSSPLAMRSPPDMHTSPLRSPIISDKPSALPVKGTVKTAEDLLANLTRSEPPPPPPPAPVRSGQGLRLYDSGDPIWAPPGDNGGLKFSAAAGTSLSQLHHAKQPSLAAPPVMPPTYPTGGFATDASASFSPPIQQPRLPMAHTRTISQPMVPSRTVNGRGHIYDSPYLVTPRASNLPILNMSPPQAPYADQPYMQTSSLLYESQPSTFQTYPDSYQQDVFYDEGMTRSRSFAPPMPRWTNPG